MTQFLVRVQNSFTYYLAADPMASMIASIRTGNIALRKVKAETKVRATLDFVSLTVNILLRPEHQILKMP